MMVSVICQTYNHENYIVDCLESLVSQKVDFRYEILVHDDASTDKTAEIIRGFEKKYPDLIKPIYQKVNQWSLGKKVLTGIQLPRCTGKYVAICEGDDYWIDSLKLQKQVNYLENNPDCTMSFHNAIEHWSDNRKKDSMFSHIVDRVYSGLELYKEWIVPTASVVFRRNILMSQYADCLANSHFIYKDIILFLLAAKCGRVVGMKDVMSVYRRHAGGAVFEYNVQRIIKSLEHHKYIPLVFGSQYKDISDHQRILLLLSVSHYYFTKRKFLLAFRYLTNSLVISFKDTLICFYNKIIYNDVLN